MNRSNIAVAALKAVADAKKIQSNASPYEGLSVEEAREAVKLARKALGKTERKHLRIPLIVLSSLAGGQS